MMDFTEASCKCKSTCSTRRKENNTRGCPCKGRNEDCSTQCKCGTSKKPCKNKQGVQDNPTAASQRQNKKAKPADGFRLPRSEFDTEENQRIKENNDVKNFIATLDEAMVRKLAIRGLRRGVGSMDYIDSLLIMEDDLEEEDGTHAFEDDEATADLQPQPDPSAGVPVVDWCVCGFCSPMPQAIENRCCKLKKCITSTARFTKLCLDPDVLELCIRNTSDIRNDREDTSTRAFRKAAYRQFILARHGHLGKGNRRVCPSCVVKKIRLRYPSVTGVYMGYREH